MLVGLLAVAGDSGPFFLTCPVWRDDSDPAFAGGFCLAGPVFTPEESEVPACLDVLAIPEDRVPEDDSPEEEEDSRLRG